MKKVYVLNEHKEKLIETLEIISKTVTSTLGPSGKTCILYDGDTSPHVTKDGVTVAEFIKFKDYFMEAINQIIKETARKTGETVGDGTTTSILLACNLTKLLLISNNTLKDLLNVEEQINQIIDNIKRATVRLTTFDDKKTIKILKSIVYMSSNGDMEITDLIVDILEQIGPDGVIDVTTSNNELTKTVVQKGMLIEAPAHVVKSETVDNPYIVLSSSGILKTHEFISCLQLASQLYSNDKKSSMVVIAKEFSQEIQDAVFINNRNGRTNVYLVESDGFAYNRFQILDDMSSLLGCKILSTDSSSPYGLQNITLDHMTRIKSATISPQQTILYSDKFESEENEKIRKEISDEISELRKTGENKVGEISGLEKRLSKFSKSAVIYVGGFTDAAKREKLDRVDDAVKALASAVNGGVIPGGGYSLYKHSRKVNSSLVRSVCAMPADLLNQNTNKDIYDIFKTDDTVMNFITEEVGNAFELGILDPADVAVKALQQAIVIVKLLLNTHSIIVPDEV